MPQVQTGLMIVVPCAAVTDEVWQLLRAAPTDTAYRAALTAALRLPGNILSDAPDMHWARLAWTCCIAAGGGETQALCVAAVVEVFMVALDVLDDAEDGEETVLQAELGAARALNVSTGLLFLAQRGLLAVSGGTALTPLLLDAGLRACSGQHADLTGAQGRSIGLDDALAVTAAKSASLVAAICALGLLPVSFAYAILRHNSLDVRLLQRWFVRGVLWGGLLALYIVVAYAAEILPLAAVPVLVRNVAVDVALMVFGGMSIAWLREAGYPWLDRRLFKDGYDYRGSLERLSRDLSLAGNLGSLGARLPETLRQLMNLDFAVLLVHDAHGTGVCGGAGIDQPDLLAALVATAADVTDEPRAAPLACDDLTVLIVPLRTHDTVVAHLCLGPKATGEPFRAEDRALLATLSGHLAAIVRNAQLVDDLRGKVQALDALNGRLQRAQEEERARLAADLHDEPLQTALSLQRQIAIDGHNRAATAGHLALSRTLVAQLRDLCTAARPAALDHLGLHAALDQLARDRGAHAGFPILVDADPEIMEVALPAAAETALYRATQEALNNCLRHARPHTARITLRRHGDGVRLVVADDGVGFVVPDQFDDLAGAGHVGLAGLRVRVQHVGGQLCVTSTPGAGTVVQVDLPLGGGPTGMGAPV